MRVKTPNISKSKGAQRAGSNFEPSSLPQKQARATTAAGLDRAGQTKNELVTPKGRMIGTAQTGQRRKIGTKLLNTHENHYEEDYASNAVFAQTEYNTRLQTNESTEGNNNQSEICNRPPSRQKEPSLALGIGSEYGEEAFDDETNKITSEIILTSGIPAPTCESSKYASAQVKRGFAGDQRPPSRHKTPPKAVELDDYSSSSRSPPDSRQIKGLGKGEDRVQGPSTANGKADGYRRKTSETSQRKRGEQITNFLENGQRVDAEARNTYVHGLRHDQGPDLFDDGEPKKSNYQ